MTNIYQLIGKRLRVHRKLVGYSQQEVARRLELESSAIISRWETGMSMPSLQNAMLLSRLYGTLVNELFWELDRDSGEFLFNPKANNQINSTNNGP